MASKKSVTQKAIQQTFFEERGIVKAIPQKKIAAGTVWPEKIIFTSDSNEAEHVSNGMYKYTKSDTKLGKFVQLYIEDIDNLKKVNLVLEVV